jgi:hypothetical protein
MNKLFFVILIVILMPTLVMASDRVIPTQDLSYSGSFRVPHTSSNSTDWGYNWLGGMTYDDGNNHIAMVGKFSADPTMVAALSIPTPVVSGDKDLSDLNYGAYVSGYGMTDITNGEQVNGLDGIELSDIQYIPTQAGQSTDKMIWIVRDPYAATTDYAEHIGWAEADFTSSTGAWYLSGVYSRNYDGYLLDINTSWATSNVSGQFLGLGRCKGVASEGPTLYASAPWSDNSGNPPTDGSALSNTTLIYYPPGNPMEAFNRATSYNDAVWVTVGDKQAFVVLSTMGIRSEEGRKFWYDKEAVSYKGGCNNYTTISSNISDSDTSIPLTDSTYFTMPSVVKINSEHMYCTGKTGDTLTGCTRGYNSTVAKAWTSGITIRQVVSDIWDYGAKVDGYEAFPYIPMLLFYDADQIAEIAAGTRETYDIQPYAYFSLDKWFYESMAVDGSISAYYHTIGIAYDETNQNIYIGEYLADGDYPLIHVFNLSDIGNTLDTTPPSAPASFTNNSGTLSWAEPEDDAEYIIFKYYDRVCEDCSGYRPVDVTLNTSWTDTLYNAGDKYRVVAYDQSMNSSDDQIVQVTGTTLTGVSFNQ